jgi:integrase
LAACVQALTTLEVQRLYAQLLTSGRKDGRPGGLSRTTVGHVHRALHRALEQAVRWRLLGRNVVRDAELPPGERAAMVTLDRELARRLRAVAEGSTLEIFVALGLATGARRGELLALRWADVDLEAGVVRIERSLQLVGGQLHVKLPKSEAGKRLVPLPRSAVGELRRHRTAQTERRLMIGPRYDTAADLVVAKADGAPFRPAGAFRALVRRAGLPVTIHVHTLRHTVGSWLADAGVPPHDIAAILGHRDAGFTLRTYVHSLPDALRRAADTLDDALGAKP